MALNSTKYISKIEFQAGFKCLNSSLVSRKGVLVEILLKSIESKTPSPTREKVLFDFAIQKIKKHFFLFRMI